MRIRVGHGQREKRIDLRMCRGGAFFVDPPITWAPHARVSDPTARRPEGRGGLASGRNRNLRLPGRSTLVQTKNIRPILEHRRGPPRHALVHAGARGSEPLAACRCLAVYVRLIGRCARRPGGIACAVCHDGLPGPLLVGTRAGRVSRICSAWFARTDLHSGRRER